MVRAERIRLSVSLSANESFKLNYGRTLRWSMLAAVIVLGLLWMFLPRYEPAPYVLVNDYVQIIDLVEDIPIVDEERPIAAPPQVKELEPVEELDPGAEEFPDFVWPVEGPQEGCGCVEIEEPVFVASSSNPRLTFQAKPDYPQVARMSGLEGTVIVEVLVGTRGTVEQVRLAQGVHPLLNQAALAAAMRCRFEAGTQRSMPVAAWVSVPYRFRLH